MNKVTKNVLAMTLTITTLFSFPFRESTNKTPVDEWQQAIVAKPAVSVEEAVVEPEKEILWSEEDVEALTRTLAGECYDDKVEDKFRVCEVVLNRVSVGGFGGSTIRAVVSAPHQFNGYWSQSRPVSENDREVAAQALSDWYANGCKPLSELLYFSSGENRENVFRSDF